MILWIIEPRDPLIVRDGRPFGPNPGARAATLAFPFPSTIAGGLRHKAGLASNGGFDPAKIGHVLELGIRGPLLVQLDPQADTIAEWLPPAPADALVLETESPDTEHVRIQWLAPRQLAGASSLPTALVPVAQHPVIPNKISGRTPHFWHAAAFQQWLAAPGNREKQQLVKLGIGQLEVDARVHVSVLPDTLTAREGALFQTQGLVFTQNDGTRLALAAHLEHDDQPYQCAQFQQGGLAPLGGERRVMRWLPTKADVAGTQAPPELRNQIIEARRCRVLLLTPGCFAAGYRPPLEWVRKGVTANLKAALVQRAQVVSGWDLQEGKPKPTRRLAPAGSVYFIEWEAGADVAAWLDVTWMRNVSDDPKDCRDGFGLAVYGAWPREEEQR